MQRSLRPLLSAALLATALPALAADASEKDINQYLVDITGGAVGAAGLVGLDPSAISQIETSQDLVMALQPLVKGDQKGAFGFAVTPARTGLIALSGKTYAESRIAQMLANLTLSHARAEAESAGRTYRKTAFSLATTFYLDEREDPIFIGRAAFAPCIAKTAPTNAADVAAIVGNAALSPEARQAALVALNDRVDGLVSACIDQELKDRARWNSSRLSISFGEGRVKSDTGEHWDLGRSLTVNGQFRVGEPAVVAVSLRHTRKALEMDSLGTGTPSYRNASLVAARYTYGDREGTKFRALFEVSNARSTSAAAAKETFLYALGVDRKLGPGIWLELRLGRNRSTDSGKEQNAALANINISPTLTAFKL